MNPDKIRSILNILFMVLALATIIAYLVVEDGSKVLICICSVAILVKLMESFVWFTDR